MDKNVIDNISCSRDILNGEIPVTLSWLLCLNIEQFLRPQLLQLRKHSVSFTKAINSETGPYWYVRLRIECLYL